MAAQAAHQAAADGVHAMLLLLLVAVGAQVAVTAAVAVFWGWWCCYCYSTCCCSGMKAGTTTAHAPAAGVEMVLVFLPVSVLFVVVCEQQHLKASTKTAERAVATPATPAGCLCSAAASAPALAAPILVFVFVLWKRGMKVQWMGGE